MGLIMLTVKSNYIVYTHIYIPKNACASVFWGYLPPYCILQSSFGLQSRVSVMILLTCSTGLCVVLIPFEYKSEDSVKLSKTVP